MVRVILSRWAGLLIGGLFGGLNPRTQGSHAHHAMLQARLTRDQAFADSGFWDFALLSLYDYGVRRLVLGGVTALSEFGWTERALIGSSRALDFAPAASPLGVLKNLAAVFSHLGMNLGFAFAGAATLWMASASAWMPLRLADIPGVLRSIRGGLAALLAADYWFPVERGSGLWPFEGQALSRAHTHHVPRPQRLDVGPLAHHQWPWLPGPAASRPTWRLGLTVPYRSFVGPLWEGASWAYDTFPARGVRAPRRDWEGRWYREHSPVRDLRTLAYGYRNWGRPEAPHFHLTPWSARPQAELQVYHPWGPETSLSGKARKLREGAESLRAGSPVFRAPGYYR